MFEHFILHLSLLAVVSFVGVQLYIQPLAQRMPRWLWKLAVGIYIGLTGIVLYGFGRTDDMGIILDLRAGALILAVCFGGGWSGLLSLFIMSVPELYQSSSGPADIVTGLIVIACANVIRLQIRSVQARGLLLAALPAILFILSCCLAVDSEPLELHYYYLLGLNILGSLFIAMLFRYLLRAADWQAELRRTRDELSTVLRSQHGISFRLLKKDGEFLYKMISGKLLERLGIPVGPNSQYYYDELKFFTYTRETPETLYVLRQYEAVWDKGEPAAFESELNGIMLWISLEPIVEDGAVTSIIGTAVDISERKAAERKIKESETRYKSLAENPQDCILELDHDGKILFANSYFCKVARIEPGQLLSGIRLFDSSLKLNQEQWQKHWNDIAATGKKIAFETSIAMMDGEVREFDVMLSDVKGTSEEAGYMICTMHEITDLKQADQESQAKSRFLARVSHEIRTPLNGIIGLTQLMKHTELSSVQQDYVHKILSSSHLLLGIITDILDLSKIEAGKLNMEQAEFHMDELLYELSSTLSVLKGIKQIEVILDSEAGLPAVVVGDPLRLKQILMNLCSNAIKFTDQGHVILRVERVREEEGRIRMRFTVEDSGIGMTGDQIRMLYEPFWQADHDRGRMISGTGLGLPIVKELVTLLGGVLRADSVLGEGSRFQFEVDLAVNRRCESHSWLLGSSDGEPSHVHIVEDNPRMRETLMRTVESFSCRATTSGSWEEMYRYLENECGESNSVHCIVLDMEMDDMYGEHSWNRAMSLIQNRGIGVIATTSAYAREEIVQMMGSRLPDAMLTKPASRLELYRTLDRIIHGGMRSENRGLVAAAVSAADPSSSEANSPRCTVLLVEDNVINQQVAIELLQYNRFDVIVAGNGLEALDLLQQNDVGIILMDMYMPLLNGYETSKRIRANAEYAGIPIIALTANAMRNDHQSYYDIGINDILLKPLDAELLNNCLNKWQTYVHRGSKQSAEKALYDTVRETIAGVDVDRMLQRLEGKISILLHILRLFKKEYASFGQRLERKLQAGLMREAQREAHTLKGVAQNMSAHRLAVAAIQLEAVLFDNPEAYRPALDAAVEEINAIISSLPAIEQQQ